MPEVPLWKLKIAGEECPPPDENEDVPVTRLPTPEESDQVEFPHVASDIAGWYETKKKEYELFDASSEASDLRSRTQKFLSEGTDMNAFLRSLRNVSGTGAWTVLRVFFETCKDSVMTDQVVTALWKPATEWILHEEHREITMHELKDLWKDLDSIESPVVAVEPKEEETPLHPEFDENFRYVLKDEDE